MGMVTSIFTTLGDIVDAFGTLLGNLFTEVVGLIYTPGENPVLTDFGTIVLIALGTGLVLWAIRFILSYVKISK